MKSPERLRNRLRDRCVWLSLLLRVVLYLAIPLVAQDARAAYQGFGADTLGGEGKPFYHVTNLNDSGAGSLRDALSQGNRYIIFDLGGEILLQRRLYVQGANITIDGFTAPYPGITLKNYSLSITGEHGAHDVIVRGIRIRGAGSSADTEQTDGINVVKGAYNVVIDHVSIHGSEDGNLDIGTGAHDVTVSWSILAEPQGTQKNMLIKHQPSRITLHHNIFVRARQRNPQVAIDNAGTPATDTTVDMRNNLVWDWGGGYGTLIWYGSRANIVNNFYSNPSGSVNDKGKALRVCKGECDGGNLASAARGYVNGNHSADGINLDAIGTETTPFPAPSVDSTDACTAAHQVLADAGVKPRDVVDEQYLLAISLPSCGGSVDPTTEVTVTPSRLDFSATIGGSSSSAKTLTVTDSSGGGLSWIATTGVTWLSLSRVNGTTPSAVTAAVNSSGLTEGSYLASISIAAPSATGSPLVVPVTLTVSPTAITQITSPNPGSVLSGSDVTFSWTANGADVRNWRLYVGSTQGARDLHDSGKLNASRTSRNVRRLPTDGRVIWVQLRFDIGGSWQSADFQYIAALK